MGYMEDKKTTSAERQADTCRKRVERKEYMSQRDVLLQQTGVVLVVLIICEAATGRRPGQW